MSNSKYIAGYVLVSKKDLTVISDNNKGVIKANQFVGYMITKKAKSK